MKKLLMLSLLVLTTICFAGVKINGAGIEFSTIQDAVDAATDGDVLIVTTGTFAEAVDIYGKNIDISGGYSFNYSTKAATGSTVIDPAFLQGSCFDFSNAVVTLNDLELTGPSFLFAGSGGGLDLRFNSEVTAINCDIHDCIAPDDGGGAYVNNSTLTLTNTPIYECAADYGGGIYAANDSKIFLSGSSAVSNNAAAWVGGGVRLINNSSCDVSGQSSDIKNNYAEVNGGGVAASSGSSFVLHDWADVIGNVAEFFGGGIYLSDSSTGVFYGYDTSIGYSFPPTGLYPNSVTNGSGGGLYANDSVVIVSNEARFVNNIASENGGGIYLTNSSLLLSGADIGIPDITSTNEAKNGGGIFATDSSIIITNNSRILRSYARGEGGGIYANDCLVKIYSSDIGSINMGYGNIAFAAAGVELFNSECEINNSRIIGNQAFFAGGLTFLLTNNVLVKNSIISNNFTYGFEGGAGVYSRCDGGSYIFDNTKIVNNTDLSAAGGIFWDSDSTLIMRNGSELCNNASSNDFGGAYIRKGNFVVENSKISGNRAVSGIGGIGIIYGKAKLTDCTIENNNADIYNKTNGVAGAIFLENSKLDIVASNSNFLIISNLAASGGAIYAMLTSDVSIVTYPGRLCRIAGNTAIKNGGVCLFEDETSAKFSGNIIINDNHAKSGAGMYVSANCTFSTFPAHGDSVSFVKNSAESLGGGIYCDGPNSALFLTNALFSENTANVMCGGIYGSDNSEITLINSKFLNNYAYLYSAIGCGDSKVTIDSDFSYPNPSGIPLSYFGGNTATGAAGVFLTKSDVFIANTAFFSNRSESVGAIYIAKSTGVLENIIVADNYGGGFGDGIAFSDSSKIEMLQCTVANNYSNGVYIATNNAPVEVKNCIVWGHLGEQISSNATVFYSDIQGGFPGLGNITNDPLFVDPTALNYQVQLGSETIDTGMTLVNVTNDCIGNPRPYDGDWDMGAYEVVPEPAMFLLLLLVLFSFVKRN